MCVGGGQWRFFFFFCLSGKRKNGGDPGGVCTLPKGGKKYFGTELRIFPQEEVKTSNLGNEKDDRFHLNASPNAISQECIFFSSILPFFALVVLIGIGGMARDSLRSCRKGLRMKGLPPLPDLSPDGLSWSTPRSPEPGPSSNRLVS